MATPTARSTSAALTGARMSGKGQRQLRRAQAPQHLPRHGGDGQGGDLLGRGPQEPVRVRRRLAPQLRTVGLESDAPERDGVTRAPDERPGGEVQAMSLPQLAGQVPKTLRL